MAPHAGVVDFFHENHTVYPYKQLVRLGGLALQPPTALNQPHFARRDATRHAGAGAGAGVAAGG